MWFGRRGRREWRCATVAAGRRRAWRAAALLGHLGQEVLARLGEPDLSWIAANQIEAGNPREALRLGVTVDPSGLPSLERQSTHHVQLAHAYMLRPVLREHLQRWAELGQLQAQWHADGTASAWASGSRDEKCL